MPTPNVDPVVIVAAGQGENSSSTESSHRPLPPLWLLTSRFEIDPSAPSGLRWKMGIRRGRPVGSLNRTGYWQLELTHGGDRHRLQAHRVVYYLSTEEDPGELEVDHINRDRGDNRIENLRLCTHRENGRNLTPREGGSSAFHGVSYHAARDRWRAYIQTEEGSLYLGSFPTEQGAARAYDQAALQHHGEFATVNFPNWREVPA